MFRPLIDMARLHDAHEQVCSDLMALRTPDGHWEGQLSSSALSTATALSALALARRASTDTPGASRGDEGLIERGISWIAAQQNPDGGWGDTDKSHSNIATTMLVVAAIHLTGRQSELAAALARARAYTEAQGHLSGLAARYGRDKTFAVPILTNYALAGLIDWSDVPPLPFELACIPQTLYRWARMPVVSYAIPALVAIGQTRFCHRPPRFPPARWVRAAAVPGSLGVLDRMQPASGGFLEAVPLTSFVVMSLLSAERSELEVVRRGLAFIRSSVRSDGSWPIDTNLATWNTSLAINALAADGRRDVTTSADLDWLLGCQHTRRHPYTGAAPGGWGWTDLSGAVPDADDTAAALLALHQWRKSPACSVADQERIERASQCGLTWLLGLQNRDGGWPTFCRGWGKLPFDRSGADLTAHAMRALQTWRTLAPAGVERALRRGWRYLESSQRDDGSWVPLWFGHQDHPREENPVFGTARVLLAYHALGRSETLAAQRGCSWLESVHSSDGGWNGSGGVARGRPGATAGDPRSSVEETALAVEALLTRNPHGGPSDAVARGLQWLIDAVSANQHRETAPIGFYFAKLWYHERLYPLTFAVAALGHAVCRFGTPTTAE